jgi:glycosyltransferase involved in cell wall biosynthesis
MLWDTGSTDRSIEIEKELARKYPKKISLKQRQQTTIEDFTNVRQEMLEKTNADWLMLVDGDEVWWENSINNLVKIIREKGNELESIISPSYNVVGDIYHYQEESAGRYKIDGMTGHLNIRAMNLDISGLHAEKPHGLQGYYDKDGIVIQERSRSKRIFLDLPYMHFTNVIRSSTRNVDLHVPKRQAKLKYEIGVSFPKDFYYPEVFFRPRSEFVESPWKAMDNSFKLLALIQTPLRKIKRKIWQGRTGY